MLDKTVLNMFLAKIGQKTLSFVGSWRSFRVWDVAPGYLKLLLDPLLTLPGAGTTMEVGEDFHTLMKFPGKH